MSTTYEPQVFKPAYDVLKEIHLARATFAKTEKYSLGEALEKAMLTVLLNIVRAGRAKREWTTVALDEALAALEQVKILVRLGYDLKQITERRYIAWQATLQNIGRQLGGWRRQAA